MGLENKRRNQLATSIALAIIEPDAQVVPDMRLAVWCVQGEEWWLGYDEESVAEAYRREYNLDADECTTFDVDFVQQPQLEELLFDLGNGLFATFAEKLAHERYSTNRTVPRVFAYWEQ